MKSMVDEKRLARGMWWDRALRLTAGCTKISPACCNCWAETEANIRMRQKNEQVAVQYRGSFDGKQVHFLEANLKKLSGSGKPRVWSVWNDLFHHSITWYEIALAFAAMSLKPDHRIIICSKRVERMREWNEDITFMLDNFTFMTTIESQAYESRLERLVEIPALRKNLALSVEPLLGPLWLDPYELQLIGTVVIGCESGPRRRPCNVEWVRDLARQCDAAGAKVFVKQLDIGGKVVGDIDVFPEDLRRRELTW